MQQKYYELISSLDELVGEIGLLRLPKYIFKDFVFDDARRRALEIAISALQEGKNVLIVGNAGVGKTALMAIIIKHLVDKNFKVGYILEYAREILNTHTEEGIILFYDDLPRMQRQALRSIVINRVTGILATSRLEELDELRRKLGLPIEDIFVMVEIGTMTDDSLREILYRFAREEGIEVDPEAANILIKKARNLPVYIWQAIRDLRIQGKTRLSVEFAEHVPIGMLNYVDEILWRILDEHPDRYALLLTLLIISDLPKYEINSDVLTIVFAEALKEIRGTKVSIVDTALHELFGKMVRYLIKIDQYTYKLPHDSWGDVLKGKSTGLMSGEISRINILYPTETRKQILARAIEITQNEIIAIAKDPQRKRKFEEFVSKLDIRPERKTKELKTEQVTEKLYAVTRKTLPSNAKVAKRSPIYRAIINTPIIWSLLKTTKTRFSRLVEYSKLDDNTGIIKYPTTENLKIEHKLYRKEGRVALKKDYIVSIISLIIAIVFGVLTVIYTNSNSALLFLTFVSSALLLFSSIVVIRQGRYTQVVIEELSISGKKDYVDLVVKELKNAAKRRGLSLVRLDEAQRKLLEKLGYDPEEILKAWQE